MSPIASHPYCLIEADVAALSVDPRYQRSLATRTAEKLIETIVKDFNWLMFGCPIVASDGQAGWTVIDGQHRVEAARRMGFETIPCIEIDADTLKEQAAAFVGINRRRRKMTTVEIFHAEIAAGDPLARSIRDGLGKYNIKVARYQKGPFALDNDEISCVGSLKRLMRGRKPDGFDRIIGLVVAIWPDDPTAFRSQIIGGLAAFDRAFETKPYNRDHLITALSDEIPDRLIARARHWRELHGGSVQSAMLNVMASLYDKGLRKSERLVQS